MHPSTGTVRRRLETITSTATTPWQYADSLRTCWLYWLSSDTFPMMTGPKLWILQFLDAFAAALKDDLGLEPKQFLQTGLLPAAIRDVLTNRALEMQTLPG